MDIYKPFCGGILQKFFTPHYYWKVTDCLAGYFTRIFPNSLHYIWTFLSHFVRVLCKFFYTSSLLLESFKPFVGVFLKKFIKISHRADFGCFDFPAFMLETSTQKLFSSS